MSRLRLVTPLCTALLFVPACKHPSTRLDLEKIASSAAALCVEWCASVDV